MASYIKWFDEIGLNDINEVGGKNASLGEMVSNFTELDIKIPYGFAVTTHAFDYFMKYNDLFNYINECVENITDNDDLVVLKRNGMKIRNSILEGNFPEEIEKDIIKAYHKLSQLYKDSDGNPQINTDVAVRSSGTAEDLPDASFAGQQETYLNVRTVKELLFSIKKCFSSLYTDRAISYRKSRKLFSNIKLSVAVQKMVRSDLGSAGVAFSVDTESGYDQIILINSAYGLGEIVVSGQVNPDEIIIFKPSLRGGKHCIIEKKIGNKTHKIVYATNPGKKIEKIRLDSSLKNKMSITNQQALELGRYVLKLEKYYSKVYNRTCPLDIEWAIDGITNELFIVQARPETVVSKTDKDTIMEYNVIKDNKFKNSKILVRGVAVGKKMSTGRVRKLYSLDNREKLSQNDFFRPGDILVTDMTDPDWEPIMKISGGIITNRGGRTCHASIVARELGVPAIVGTINCTEVLKNDQEVSLINDGDIGKVYSGQLNIKINEINIKELPPINTKLMFNIASPEIAFNYHNYPVHGVGLVRQEFMFNNYIKVHPMALLKHKELNDPELTKEINKLIEGYDDENDYFLKKLSYGLSRIGAAFKDHDVIVRFSDFKSNEYRNLLGGKHFEPIEENPMIGWRGASRYYSPKYREAFGMECKAIKYIRDEMGLTNIVVMIPFCRTVGECIRVQATMKEYGLERGKNGLRVYLMCEVPSNVILAEQFAKYIDGFSIGSNDLTQLTLGLDRDSELVQYLYDERNDAVKEMLKMVIRTCKRTGTKIGICGQGPSDYPELAEFLMKEGIDTISITPDSLLHTMNVLS